MRSDIICIENVGNNVANIRLYKTNIVKPLNKGDVLKLYAASDSDYFYYKNNYDSRYIKVTLGDINTSFSITDSSSTKVSDLEDTIELYNDVLGDVTEEDQTMSEDASLSDTVISDDISVANDSTDIDTKVTDITPKKRRGRKPKEEVSNND